MKLRLKKIVSEFALRKGALALSAVLGLPLCGSALAQPQNQPIRVLVMNDQTSETSQAAGLGSFIAAKLAVEDFGGTVADMPVVVTSLDHQNKVDIAAAAARKGFEVGEIDAIFDIAHSAASLAIQDIARAKQKIVVHVGSAVSDLYGKDCSPTGAQWLFDSYSLGQGLTKAVFAEGGTSWFFLTADYAFGKAMQAEAERTLRQLNGKTLGAVRFPLLNHDFSSFLLQAQAASPKVLGLAAGGADAMNAIKQAREFGMEGSVRYAVFVMFLNNVKALGPESAKGLQYLSGFYWDRDEGSRAFAKRFAAQSNGNMPTEIHAGVYSAVRHYLRAVAETRSHDGLTNMRQMKAMPLNDFYAPGATIRSDGRLMNDQYLLEAKGPGEVKAPWDILKVRRTVKAADIVRPIDEGGCTQLDGPSR